ncbi:MAG: hypothetical protein HY217_09100 [Candidatus Rokubacteria bacterium]|nr:hypothetical protein [Candidatus Rokubacteria bacterium]
MSSARVLEYLRLASRKGDRAALTLALEQMKILALSPRYWEKYLALLANPLARLVDLLVIKQGERIARQKGRKVPATARRPRKEKPRPRPPRRRRPAAPAQPSLFPELLGGGLRLPSEPPPGAGGRKGRRDREEG